MDSVLSRWLEALNHCKDEARARSVLAVDVTIDAFIEGADGERTRMCGIDDALRWIQKAPEDTFVFEALESTDGVPHPDLPAGERALRVRFKISAPDPAFGSWYNHGWWTLHIAGDRVVAARHVPDTLSTDHRSNFTDMPIEDYTPQQLKELYIERVEEAERLKEAQRDGHEGCDHDH